MKFTAIFGRTWRTRAWVVAITIRPMPADPRSLFRTAPHASISIGVSGLEQQQRM
jgi:hypothetical protein